MVSFGSEHELMYRSAQTNSKSNVREAVERVMRMGADLGGTHLSEALEWIYNNLIKRDSINS